MSENKLIRTVKELKEEIHKRDTGDLCGFVPTMGALHAGHLSLVEKAKAECKIVVVSIFVNPHQFNNSSDLEKYPRTLDSDLDKLSVFQDLLVFAPSVEEIYPDEFKALEVDLGYLDQVMEGAFRPGHFKGVVTVVKRLFDIVEPDRAYFGLKDFQQLAVIVRMVEALRLPVTVVPCEVIREFDGLAMSSRNARLNEREKKDALQIYNALLYAKELSQTLTPSEVKDLILAYFKASPLQLEYFELAEAKTLQPSACFGEDTVAFVAAQCGPVRLIDNMRMR